MSLILFQVQDLTVRKTSLPKQKPDDNDLVFGQNMSDHMLLLEWDKGTGWKRPIIEPYGDLLLDPTSSVFHYGSEVTISIQNAIR